MALIRMISAIFLALTLAVTSVSFAVARGHAPASHAMEICVGYSMVVVWVDENGNPVEERQICPDALSFLAQAEEVDAVPLFAPSVIKVVAPISLSYPETHEALSPSARGPPVLV